MMHREPNYWPDVASEIDSPEELLAEALGCDLQTATKVQRWHEGVVEAEAARQKSEQLTIIVATLLKHSDNYLTLKVRLQALAFAAGLDLLNGLHSQSESARQLGGDPGVDVPLRHGLGGHAAFGKLQVPKK